MVIETLTKAFHTEVAGYNFYPKAIEKVDNENAKAMFNRIARDELDHIRVLSTIADTLTKEGKWLTYEDALSKGASTEGKGLPIFPTADEVAKRLDKKTTELDVLNIAIEVEEKAIDLYSKELKGTGDANLKSLLSRLLEMERGHLSLLRWEYEALVQTGFWCDSREFNPEEEKGG
ncbi:MAG: ferritin family protein [Deltaproteobacteria bacterium]|nr:ferritin family protein [Deltaproteobacteria bacterium]